MQIVLLISLLISLAATWITTKKWIRRAPDVGLVGRDMNKPGTPNVVEMGGICIVFGFMLGIMIYIASILAIEGKSISWL